MTNTIEVPISLIKAGDLDAIRELLPKPNLFGRWATHPNFGRGIICSMYARNGYIQFAYESREVKTATVCDWVFLDALTLDPVELATKADFEDAPVGTVVAEPQGNIYQHFYADEWEGLADILGPEHMATSGPWKILRWGWGE